MLPETRLFATLEKERKKEMENEFTLKTCPICKKKFVPAIFHIYHVGNKKVCSYKCQLAHERSVFARDNRKIPIITIDKEGNITGQYDSITQAATKLGVDDYLIRDCINNNRWSVKAKCYFRKSN